MRNVLKSKQSGLTSRWDTRHTPSPESSGSDPVRVALSSSPVCSCTSFYREPLWLQVKDYVISSGDVPVLLLPISSKHEAKITKEALRDLIEISTIREGDTTKGSIESITTCSLLPGTDTQSSAAAYGNHRVSETVAS
ncbi:hypothetical protein GOODEAATRI_015882 [Goodea atripinnis]|uniref:Uncharacterized protein n=1 Tax=Goodea atripinnis TaxID=208336 RepID=A0ABV0MTV3_9TELE